jgi:hypothetical protein
VYLVPGDQGPPAPTDLHSRDSRTSTGMGRLPLPIRAEVESVLHIRAVPRAGVGAVRLLAQGGEKFARRPLSPLPSTPLIFRMQADLWRVTFPRHLRAPPGARQISPIGDHTSKSKASEVSFSLNSNSQITPTGSKENQ